MIVLNGICFKLFMREVNQWVYTAYMNLLDPKQTYSFEDDVCGAVEFFTSLTP